MSRTSQETAVDGNGTDCKTNYSISLCKCVKYGVKYIPHCAVNDVVPLKLSGEKNKVMSTQVHEPYHSSSLLLPPAATLPVNRSSRRQFVNFSAQLRDRSLRDDDSSPCRSPNFKGSKWPVHHTPKLLAFSRRPGDEWVGWKSFTQEPNVILIPQACALVMVQVQA